MVVSVQLEGFGIIQKGSYNGEIIGGFSICLQIITFIISCMFFGRCKRVLLYDRRV